MTQPGEAVAVAATVEPSPGAVGGAVLRRPRLALAMLAVGQVVSWGVLYYALIVAAPVIAADTGWGVDAVVGLFSLGLVVAALAGIAVGRAIDDRGPRAIMAGGSALGAAGLAVVAVAPTPVWFAVGWVVVGVAQAAVLYQAVFTVLTRRYGPRRRGALTVITLAGGLASTIFAPTVAVMLPGFGWRATFLALAVLLAVTTVPIHLTVLERRWPVHEPHDELAALHPSPGVRAVLRLWWFWRLTAATALTGVAMYAATLSLVPLLMERGIPFELAAVGLGLLGAGQVAGRLLYLALPHRAAPWVPFVVVGAAATVLLGALGLIPGPAWLLIAVAVLVGAVRGAQTLVQASAVADRWGTADYGVLNGVSSAPVTIVLALSPAIGALVASGLGSYALMTLVMAGVAGVAAILSRAT